MTKHRTKKPGSPLLNATLFCLISSFSYCNKSAAASTQKNTIAAAFTHEAERENISPIEDLMREHGLLNRLLLIMEKISKTANNAPFPLDELTKTLSITQNFVENYHEKMEEDYIFPLFERANKELKLVATLRTQHNQGRKVTSRLRQLCSDSSNLSKKTRKTIIKLLKKFIYMYRPHEAREDTVLFPQVYSLATESDLKKMADLFETYERERLGQEGFEGVVKQVTALEKKLGIYELEQFTPSIR